MADHDLLQNTMLREMAEEMGRDVPADNPQQRRSTAGSGQHGPIFGTVQLQTTQQRYQPQQAMMASAVMRQEMGRSRASVATQQAPMAQQRPGSAWLRQEMEQPVSPPAYPAQSQPTSLAIRKQMPAFSVPQSHRQQFLSSQNMSHQIRPMSSQSQGLSQEPHFQSHFWIIPHNFLEYQPLRRPEEIRVLRINPGPPDSAVDCELYHTDVQSDWDYHALSYAWGDKTAKSEIICSGKRLQITTSLHSALRRIRNANYPVQVWADAVCINQQDVDERGHQVRLMRSIYKRAKSVLIWLGPDEQGAASAVFTAARSIFARDMVHVPHPADNIWIGFALLFGRTWFWRLWCLQEIVLASFAEIMWGSESISWECLGFAAAWIRTVGYQIQRNSPVQGVHNAYLMYALSVSKDKHDPVSFIHLLTFTRQFQVSDPRDRVYALLGLPTTDSDPDAGKLYVDPDYTKSREEVYEILARKMLVSSQGLRTLSAVQHGLEVEENLPSWVPQWDRLFTYTFAQASASLRNHAAAATLPLSVPRIIGSVLNVDGLEFDVAIRISDVLPDSLDPSSTSNFEYINTICASVAASLVSYPTGTDLYTAFCWTITAGKDWYGMLIENEMDHLADFAAFQEKHCISPLADFETRKRFMPIDTPEPERQKMMKMSIGEFYSTIAVLKAQERGTDMANESAVSIADADRFVTALSFACRWRRFFITQKGFMGIGPPCMKEGDVVSILSGGIVPFLLRKRAPQYKFVGEAYIYGIMNGEACEQPLRDHLQVHTFSLS